MSGDLRIEHLAFFMRRTRIQMKYVFYLPVLIGAFGIAILPMILYMAGNNNILNIMRCILPTRGFGLINGLQSELMARNFALVAGHYIWLPYILGVAAVVVVPVFVGLTIVSYCRRGR